MLVHQILKSKGDHSVVTAKPGTTIREAAELLATHGIGSLVISDDGKQPLGILSERDIVRQLAKSGGSILTAAVEDFMTDKLVTCTLEASADVVLSTMTEKRFRHMPVIEKDEMVGLVTLGDVVKARLSELKMEKDALEGMIMGY